MSKPLYQSLSSCFKKSRYVSENKAKEFAAKAMREREVTLRTYYCKVCMGFHLTSKPLVDFSKEKTR